jgi:hypothetical protein
MTTEDVERSVQDALVKTNLDKKSGNRKCFQITEPAISL